MSASLAVAALLGLAWAEAPPDADPSDPLDPGVVAAAALDAPTAAAAATPEPPAASPASGAEPSLANSSRRMLLDLLRLAGSDVERESAERLPGGDPSIRYVRSLSNRLRVERAIVFRRTGGCAP